VGNVLLDSYSLLFPSINLIPHHQLERLPSLWCEEVFASDPVQRPIF